MENDPTNSPGRIVVRVGQMLGMALVLYVLSVGPALAIVARLEGVFPREYRWLERVYSPLEWVCNQAPILQAGLRVYIRTWLPAKDRAYLQ